MPAIWTQGSGGWVPQPAVSYDNEAELHTLIAEAPHLLPLSGDPELTVLGKEVTISPGRVDVLAVDRTGRLAIIEVKLARNAEARRAVVGQVLSNAAHLHGLGLEVFEREVVGRHLAKLGVGSVAEAVRATDQEGDFDESAFRQSLAENLDEGRFRLVFVLDEAPEELTRLAGYLESVSDTWVVDLIVVAAYDVGGQRVLVPQRVDGLGDDAASQAEQRRSVERARLVPGAKDFRASIETSDPSHRGDPERLTAWAESLEQRGLARLHSYHGKNRMVLLPKLHSDDADLVTGWNENGASVQFWRSVFERRAPQALKQLEHLVAPLQVGQGNTTRDVSDALLTVLTAAYKEAAGQGAGG